ncbi:MAG TPA: hypothetical protein PLC65_14545 [Bacteroidia bacterium]|nr:hypothetical protein [Bacteroidia bacterium]
MKAANITLENYEAYLLDYMEGNLSKADTALLQQFVVLHPELNIDLSELELVELQAANVTFENKNNLKKEITPLVSDEEYVDYIENNLSAAEKNKIESLASQYPSVKKELGLFQKTILQPELNIVFENKSDLKKEAKVIWLFSRQTLSMAAALLLIVTFVFMFRFFNVEDNGGQELSEVKVLNTNTIAPLNSNENKENTSTASESTSETENSVNTNNKTLANVSLKNKIKNTSVSSNSITTTEPEVIVNNNSVTPSENNAIASLNTSTVSTNNTINEIVPSSEVKNKKAYIITEQAYDEDEKVLASNTEKKGLFNRARKALKNLNQMGVKTLNATENVHGDTEEYTLSVGNFTVYKNKFN